jgi:hypothetical protein
MSSTGRLCLMLARVLLSAWVGAATLFVINGVRLVTSGHFDSMARDHLSLIRFPPYYLFGFLAVGIGLVSLVLAAGYPRRLAIGLVVLSLILMLVDYFAIYLPLAEMITPPGDVRPSQFTWYHKASMYINTVHVGLCLIAAMMISRERRASLDEGLSRNTNPPSRDA